MFISFYQRAIDGAKGYLKPQTIDSLESQLIPMTALIALLGQDLIRKSFPIFEFPPFAENKWLVSSLIVAGSIGWMASYHQFLKNPAVHKKLQQIVAESKKTGPSMLIFHTSCDWNGSFLNHSQVGNYERLAKKYSIEMIKVNSKSEFKRAIQSKDRGYDRIDFHGHGSRFFIQLAKGVLLTKNSKKTLNWLNQHIKKGGIIGLDACQAGKGKENIAQAISAACPKATVYAAGDNLHSFIGSEYQEDGTPFFNNGVCCKGRNITRIYRNGISIG